MCAVGLAMRKMSGLVVGGFTDRALVPDTAGTAATATRPAHLRRHIRAAAASAARSAAVRAQSRGGAGHGA